MKNSKLTEFGLKVVTTALAGIFLGAVIALWAGCGTASGVPVAPSDPPCSAKYLDLVGGWSKTVIGAEPMIEDTGECANGSLDVMLADPPSEVFLKRPVETKAGNVVHLSIDLTVYGGDGVVSVQLWDAPAGRMPVLLQWEERRSGLYTVDVETKLPSGRGFAQINARQDAYATLPMGFEVSNVHLTASAPAPGKESAL